MMLLATPCWLSVELVDVNTKHFNITINLNFIYRPIPYRAVNTPRLGYKNQTVNAV